MHSPVCLWVLLGSWCPRLPFCLRLVGAPKITGFSPKMHQSAHNTPKWPKMTKNRVKNYRTPLLDPLGSTLGQTGVSVGPIGVMVPAITVLSALGGCPQNNRVFTNNTPKCTKYAKIAQNGLKTGKKRPHTTFGPPALVETAKSAFGANKYGKIGRQTALFDLNLTLVGPKVVCGRF